MNLTIRCFRIFLLPAIFGILLINGCHLARITEPEPSDIQEEISQLEKQLEDFPGITIRKINHNQNYFKVAYEVYIDQWIDHTDHSKGTFTQKFYLNHHDFDAPMVFNINGYSVPENSGVSELVPMLDANYIHVEHRYFADSKPQPLDYKYLTIEQAATDHHEIIEALKSIYHGKWLSTGISKGGQATIFHRRYYPEDVEASIPYVAPVNLAVEDERLIKFLDQVGTKECRDHILAFQRALLSDYDEAIQVFQQKANEKNLVFPMGIEQAFELSILEFEFAYWQWTGGENCLSIPDETSNTEELVTQLFSIDAPGFFTSASIDYFFPFFYQAYHELGMYGYAVDSLDGYLREYDEYVNNYYTFIPENMEVVYDPEPLQQVHEFLLEEGNEFIFVYGENDAWSATAFIPDQSKTNSITFFKENGSHFTRIKDLAPEQQEIVIDRLEDWLGVEIDVIK